MAGLLDFLQSASNSVASNVTAPVDGIAWLLRKAGIPVPDAPLGGSDWAQNAGLTRPVQQSASSLAGESLGMIAPMLIAAKAPQVARGLLQGAENLSAPATMNPQAGAIVWHGSPHKFDKFDASKIGTGEGAQAYGHGLYLAEAPDVASSYTKMNVHGDQLDSLSPSAKKFVREQMFSGVGSDDILKSAGMSKKQAARWDAEDLAAGKSASRVPYINAMEEVESFLAKTPVVPNNGALYKVDLPDEHIAKMLDYDLPLSQQPSILPMITPTWKGGMAKTTPWAGDESMTGQQLLNTAKQLNGTPGGASNWLSELGIPGVRYLDGASRGAGSGTSNYVIFPQNEGLLKIIERNGSPVRQPFVYPQDKALATAQRNAALPIEQGGLGLGAENTAMERARALGFTDDAFHGTPNDGIVRSRQFKNDKLGKSTRVSDAEKGHFTADRGEAASEYIWSNGSTDGGNVLPLLLGGNRAKATLPGEWAPGKYDAALDAARTGGFDGLDIAGTTTLGKPGNYQVSFEPKNMRSRFAAFDPMRRNEADLLGRADPELLGLLSAGLLGYGGYNALSKP